MELPDEICIFRCHFCTYSTQKSKDYIFRHLIIRHREKLPYNCDSCGKPFPGRNELAAHKALGNSCHLKGKQFSLDVGSSEDDDEYSTGVPTAPKNSEVHGPGNKAYWNPKFVCWLCDHPMRSSVTYVDHILYVHYGMLNYRCNHCDGKFETNRVLKCHVKKHHSEVLSYCCRYCLESKFPNKVLLYRHYALLHSTDPVVQALGVDAENWIADYLPCLLMDGTAGRFKMLRPSLNRCSAELCNKAVDYSKTVIAQNISSILSIFGCTDTLEKDLDLMDAPSINLTSRRLVGEENSMGPGSGLHVRAACGNVADEPPSPEDNYSTSRLQPQIKMEPKEFEDILMDSATVDGVDKSINGTVSLHDDGFNITMNNQMKIEPEVPKPNDEEPADCRLLPIDSDLKIEVWGNANTCSTEEREGATPHMTRRRHKDGEDSDSSYHPSAAESAEDESDLKLDSTDQTSDEEGAETDTWPAHDSFPPKGPVNVGQRFVTYGYDRLKKCKHCGSLFTSLQLRTHIRRVHYKPLPRYKFRNADSGYQCDDCEYKTIWLSSAKNHVASKHPPLDALTFSCDQCTYSTKVKSYLVVHKRTVHRKKKVFSCSQCTSTFRNVTDMKDHISLKHDKVYSHMCTLCSFRCGYRAALWTHMRRYHKCTVCEYTHSDSQQVSIHMEKEHGIIKKPPHDIVKKPPHGIVKKPPHGIVKKPPHGKSKVEKRKRSLLPRGQKFSSPKHNATTVSAPISTTVGSRVVEQEMTAVTAGIESSQKLNFDLSDDDSDLRIHTGADEGSGILAFPSISPLPTSPPAEKELSTPNSPLDECNQHTYKVEVMCPAKSAEDLTVPSTSTSFSMVEDYYGGQLESRAGQSSAPDRSEGSSSNSRTCLDSSDQAALPAAPGSVVRAPVIVLQPPRDKVGTMVSVLKTNASA